MKSKIGVNGLKKILKEMDEKELIQLICEMYKDNKNSAIYLESRYGGYEYNGEIVQQYQKNIYKQLDYTRNSFHVDKAKSLVKEFCELVKDKKSQADVYFAFVDAAVDLTYTLGDMNERFYDTVVNMFWNYVDIVNQLDASYIQSHQRQLEIMIDKTRDIGWGFDEAMSEAYYNIDDIED